MLPARWAHSLRLLASRLPFCSLLLGGGFGGCRPRRRDAHFTAISDGLAEVLTRVRHQPILHVALVGVWTQFRHGCRNVTRRHVGDQGDRDLERFLQLRDDLFFVVLEKEIEPCDRSLEDSSREKITTEDE